MSTRETFRSQTAETFPLNTGLLLQRKCACGTHTGGGECDSCGKTRLQRKASDHSETREVPSVVHEVLRSPGSPLDAATRSFMESRFGHDFSRVRVHTDQKAAESSEAVNAHAYTHGPHITFGPGRYAPETAEGRRLLGHELTHVMQQTAPRGAATSGAEAEHEADRNGSRVAEGRSGLGASAAPAAGVLQLEEKPTTSVSGERTGTKDAKDKFSFKVETTVPLGGDELSFGSLAFLDDLKLTTSGDMTGQPLGVSTLSSDFKFQMALTLAKLELANVKSKADALKKGKLSFGTTLGASGGLTMPFNPFDPSGSLATSLTAKASATTPSLIPSPYGKLTLGSSLSAGGSVTQTVGTDKDSVTPKADAKAGFSADFESAPSRNRFMTLGGALGDKASLTAGFETGLSGSLTPDKTSGAINVGGSLGLTGTRKGLEQFVKLQVTGDVSVDSKKGSATTTTQSFFVGISTGFKF